MTLFLYAQSCSDRALMHGSRLQQTCDMCQNITRIGHRSVHSAHTSQCRTSKKAKFAFRCCCAKFKASPTWVPDITSWKSQPYQSKWSVISDGTLGTSQVLLECVCTDRAILPLKFEAQRESPSHNSKGLSCDVETVVITAVVLFFFCWCECAVMSKHHSQDM